MRCLFFGANGYLGSHLVHFLKEREWDVTCFDIQSSSLFSNYCKIDVTDVLQLTQLDYSIDYIFWFAGLTGTFDSFLNAEKFISINEIGLINLLSVLRDKQQSPRIIFPSTRLVYKGNDLALKETDEKEPKTVYAINKLACENYLHVFNKLFHIPFTIYRVCIPYGNIYSNNYSYGTIGFFLNKAKLGENITLYGDGQLKRSFTHIIDICNLIINTCIKPEAANKIFNIGGETYSLYEVACLIAKRNGVQVNFIPWPQVALKLESGHTYFDDSSILKLLPKYKYKSLKDELL